MRQLLLLGWLLLQTATAWALNPDRHWAATPDSVGLKYESLTLTTPDHARLATWVIAPPTLVAGPPTTLVLAYGDAGNMGNWVHQARALAQAGYRVYLFDYRGYGHSSDFPIDHSQLYYHEFATDLGTVLADARQRYPHHRTGVMGFSMGTLLGAEMAAAHRCDFLITEGYVGSPQAIVALVKQAKSKDIKLPAEAVSYARLAPRIKCPWLLVAGTQDHNVPLADSEAAVRAAHRGQRRELLSFDGGHLEGFFKLTDKEFGDDYVRAIQRFLGGTGNG